MPRSINTCACACAFARNPNSSSLDQPLGTVVIFWSQTTSGRLCLDPQPQSHERKSRIAVTSPGSIPRGYHETLFPIEEVPSLASIDEPQVAPQLARVVKRRPSLDLIKTN